MKIKCERKSLVKRRNKFEFQQHIDITDMTQQAKMKRMQL